MSPTTPTTDPLHIEVESRFDDTVREVVGWFRQAMPPAYFSDTPTNEQQAHLLAIIAAKASGRPLDHTYYSPDRRTWTAIRKGNRPGVLAAIVGQLPVDRKLTRAKIHSSTDGEIVIDTFEFGDPPRFDCADTHQRQRADDIADRVRQLNPGVSREEVLEFMRRSAADYVGTVTAVRMAQHVQMVHDVSGRESTLLHVEPESDPGLSRITLAVCNARTRTMLERAALVLARANLNITRAYVDMVEDAPYGTISLLGFVVHNPAEGPLREESKLWKQLARDLIRIKWMDARSLELQGRRPELILDRAEAVVALSALVHQCLVHEDAFAFNRDRILHVLTTEQYFDITQRVLELFERRFDPAEKLDDATFARQLAAIRTDVDRLAETKNVATILTGLCDAIEAIRRTNYFLRSRFGLAMRLDPAVLRGNRQVLPFGVFFVHGRGFNGFHVRFKDIARGGLRVVTPRSNLEYAREADRLFEEVYNLSYAQQLKNKDIPEGGAKAVILLEVPDDIERCVKAFVDSILDLVTKDPATTARVRDHLGLDELLYLGPDENIRPDHIDWIAARAAKRGYAMPGAFISSKVGAGINHKRYGVTSEGVNVFLDCALRARGIDPTQQPFTLKITGGPDGDVAGNMIRILDRDYGANARIIGIADGSGVGEDPAGLDHEELLRLFREGLPIASFDRGKLSKKGRVLAVREPQGLQARNTMHCRLQSDVFVPAGGRPDTINARNWQEFLVDGKPSSAIIVEGANLYITKEAREKLTEHGALIFKDSSANKCGVICSSYEIAAAMLLSDEEFLAIKSDYVEQVLDKLRESARREALRLLGELQTHPHTSLPQLSIKLSLAINAAADRIYDSLPSWGADAEPYLRQVILEHLPQALSRHVGDRLFRDLPHAYQQRLVAKSLAARIVYREGIDFLQSIEEESVGNFVFSYLQKEAELRALVEEVRASKESWATRVADLLERAGARAALMAN